MPPRPHPLPYRLFRAAFDLLLPHHCAVCGAPSRLGRPEEICSLCREELERAEPPWCPTCGRPFASEAALSHSPAHRCADCRRWPPAFDRARALGPYEGHLRELIQLLKFRGRTRLAPALAPLLAGRLREHMPEILEGEETLVTFVPLHRNRWRERGYDQSRLLARALAGEMGLPADGLLERTRDTEPQAGLPAARRRRNLRGAFAVPRPERAAGRRILLIDDVLTTGATASACARALKASGAERVEVLTVCHSVGHFSAG